LNFDFRLIGVLRGRGATRTGVLPARGDARCEVCCGSVAVLLRLLLRVRPQFRSQFAQLLRVLRVGRRWKGGLPAPGNVLQRRTEVNEAEKKGTPLGNILLGVAIPGRRSVLADGHHHLPWAIIVSSRWDFSKRGVPHDDEELEKSDDVEVRGSRPYRYFFHGFPPAHVPGDSCGFLS
jgi:hypothetical protein